VAFGNLSIRMYRDQLTGSLPFHGVAQACTEQAARPLYSWACSHPKELQVSGASSTESVIAQLMKLQIPPQDTFRLQPSMN